MTATLTRLAPALPVLVLALALAGCPKSPPPAERPAPVSMEDILPKLKERTDFWNTYRAALNLAIESAEGKLNAKALAVAKAPGSIRLETLTPIGQTAAVLVQSETTAGLLIPSEKAAFTSRTPEALTRYFLKVSIPVDHFQHVLSATVPNDQLEGMQFFPEPGAWRGLSRQGASNRLYDWRFSQALDALVGLTILDGSLRYDIVYDPPVDLSPAETPKNIRFSSPEWKMRIQVNQMNRLDDVVETVFSLPRVPGVRAVDLDLISND